MSALLRYFVSLLPGVLHVDAVVPQGKASFYCVALVTPNTYEPHMLAGMWRMKVGIFECDSFDIYSNVSAWELFKDHVDVANELHDKVHNIGIPLFAPMVAGPPGWDASDNSSVGRKSAKHLANTPVFEKFWKNVCNNGNFREEKFTVKADIDSVLLPQRLGRLMLNRPPRPEYFFNVQSDMYGNFLHGPIELMSRGAMEILCQKAEVCKRKISQAAYGEDFYMNECLRHLGVPAVPAVEQRGFNLLYDMYTYGNWSKKTCTPLVADKMVSKAAIKYAAYHPYKNMSGWIRCRQQAASGGKIVTPQEVHEGLRESMLRERQVEEVESAQSVEKKLGGQALDDLNTYEERDDGDDGDDGYSDGDGGYSDRQYAGDSDGQYGGDDGDADASQITNEVEVSSQRLRPGQNNEMPMMIGFLLMAFSVLLTLAAWMGASRRRTSLEEVDMEAELPLCSQRSIVRECQVVCPEATTSFSELIVDRPPRAGDGSDRR